MEWILSIVGFFVGAVIAYLVAERRCRERITSLQTTSVRSDQRATDLSEQLRKEQDTSEHLRANLEAAQQKQIVSDTELRAERENLRQQRELLDNAKVTLQQTFQNLSTDALKNNRSEFITQAEQKLQPLQQLLEQYKQQIDKIEQSRSTAYSGMMETLTKVSTTQDTLQTETARLVTALRRPHVRGPWGEMVLRRTFELAGMADRCVISEQITVTNDEGQVQRPDIVVTLPEGRQVIVDSKTVLDAFLEAACAQDDGKRIECLKNHAAQVRKKVDDLHKRAYWNQFPQSADFVILFLPGEAFLYSAIEADPKLIEYALGKHILITCPSTLLAVLRIIEFTWRQRQIEENAEQIRVLGTELYDRIGMLVTHFEKLRGSIDSTVANYNSLTGSLETRVLVTARKIGEMGAKSDKELPAVEPIDRQTRELSTTTRALTE